MASPPEARSVTHHAEAPDLDADTLAPDVPTLRRDQDEGYAPVTFSTAPTFVAAAAAERDGRAAPTLVAAPDPTFVALPSGEPMFSLVTGETPAPVVDAEARDINLDGGVSGARYEPGPLLGAGGMGEVRLNVDRRIGRRIARKTLHASMDSTTARRRFLREVRVQGQLEHPAVVPVYDLGVDERGQVYFTMKRVRGETLERVIERLRTGDAEATRRFGQRRLLSAFAQACLAIHYAHARKVLHRDLKPSNIMLGDFGEVYVLDWGLAKVLDGRRSAGDGGDGEEDEEAPDEITLAGGPQDAVVGASGSLTVNGALMGTLAYMAPEQLWGRGAELDTRVDVFALGAILFEILTLQHLRPNPDVREVMRVAVMGQGVRPSDRAADVPPELDELCARALETRPADRPSAGQLAEAVESYLAGDHDLKLRRELAAKHAASARRRVESATASSSGAGKAGAHANERGGDARVEALREAMKALALDAENPEAQRLLLELLTDVSGEVPAEARPELDAAVSRRRSQGARMGMLGLVMWSIALPLVVLIGVKSWAAIGASAVALSLSIVVARDMSRRHGFGTGEAVLLAVLVSAVVGLTSSYLGPFTLVPTCAATTALLFANNATKRERPLLGVVLSLGALAPFAAEILGIFPRAYAFEPGKITIFERAIALTPRATMGAMIYSTLAFVVLATILVGSLRDALSASEQRQFLQAWYLRQLFPGSNQRSP